MATQRSKRILACWSLFAVATWFMPIALIVFPRATFTGAKKLDLMLYPVLTVMAAAAFVPISRKYGWRVNPRLRVLAISSLVINAWMHPVAWAVCGIYIVYWTDV